MKVDACCKVGDLQGQFADGCREILNIKREYGVSPAVEECVQHSEAGVAANSCKAIGVDSQSKLGIRYPERNSQNEGKNQPLPPYWALQLLE